MAIGKQGGENPRNPRAFNTMARLGGFDLKNAAELNAMNQAESNQYNEDRLAARNRGISELLYMFSDAFKGRDIQGRAQERRNNRMLMQQNQDRIDRQQQLNEFITNANIPDSQKALLGNLPFDVQAEVLVKQMFGTAKESPTSYQEYALTDDTPSSSEYEAFLNRPKGQTGKTIYQVVDGNDTFIQNISKEEALQKLPEFQQQGFKITALPSGTEPAQSTSQQLNKRLNPIINKYEGATNLINEFNVVAQRIYDTPEVANQLVAGGATAIKYLESNLEGFKNVISENKNNPIYKQFLDNPISIDTKSDFSQKISEISKGNALVKSRILDLAFVFAKARGQEGRGLSDRDFENSLNIISGGVNAEEKIATLEDAARAIASEYDTTIQVQKDLNASDVDYINKLNNIVKLPVFINPFTQVQPQSGQRSVDEIMNDPRY